METKVPAEKVWQIIWTDETYKKNVLENDDEYYDEKEEAMEAIKRVGKENVYRFVEKIRVDDRLHSTKEIKDY